MTWLQCRTARSCSVSVYQNHVRCTESTGGRSQHCSYPLSRYDSLWKVINSFTIVTIVMSWSLKPVRCSDVTHHGGVEAAHGWKISWLTDVLAWLHQVRGVCGPFDISQAFAPSWGGHEPQEGKDTGHHEVLVRPQKTWSSVTNISVSYSHTVLSSGCK